MKKSCHAFRVVFCSVMIMAMSLSMIAQRSMSLGDLKFVLPSAGMRMAARTFDMRMATTGITSDMFRTIGGVAFIQTAVPTFEIDALELSCDVAGNSASVAINDTVYELPLEVWQLQSIVNFADASGNAAVTLYGDEESPIKYHEAFVDNLMGLRLLQVDLMLSKHIMNSEMGLFPAIYGDYIFSPKEHKKYNDGVYTMQDVKVVYDHFVDIGRINSYIMTHEEFWMSVHYSVRRKSYEKISRVFFESYVFPKLSILLPKYEPSLNKDTVDAQPNTYIYTDYAQPINFNSIGQNIVFDGAPYYLFANSSNDGSEAKIDYMWTFVCKSMSDWIFLINPIVYDSAIKCCQWSAFFRYVKANYPDEWRSFKADVQRLKYDAPEVVTPINFHRDEP